MFTVASYSRKLQSITHPNARRSPASTTFAEGLDNNAPLTLTIRGIKYHAEAFKGQDGTDVVRLVKLIGRGDTVYDVSRSSSDGLVKCTRPDYEFSKAGTVSLCKHGISVCEVGLLEAPKPVPNRTQTVETKSKNFLEIKPTTTVAEVTGQIVADIKSAIIAEIKSGTMSETSPATSKPAVKIWSEADWRRAEYFHLNPPAGQTRPKPVPASPVAVESTAVISTDTTPTVANEVPTIPAEVTSIRVTEGYAAGIWHRQTKRSRWVPRQLRGGPRYE